MRSIPLPRRRDELRDVTFGEVLDTHSAFRVDPADTGRELELVEDWLLFFAQLPNRAPRR